MPLNSERQRLVLFLPGARTSAEARVPWRQLLAGIVAGLIFFPDFAELKLFSVTIAIVSAGIFFAAGCLRNARKLMIFENDFVSFLLSLRSSIRIGKDPLQAIVDLSKDFSGTLLGECLGDFEEKISAGQSETQAISRFCENVDHPELPLFKSAYLLARNEGAPLALYLQRLVVVIRQRQAARRKKRSAVAMQRLSALAMGGCSLIVAAMQCVTNYQAMKEAFHNPAGIYLFTSSIILIVSGTVWMLLLTRDRV